MRMVQEYMDGGSLEDLVCAGGCSSEAVLANIAYNVLQVGDTRSIYASIQVFKYYASILSIQLFHVAETCSNVQTG